MNSQNIEARCGRDPSSLFWYIPVYSGYRICGSAVLLGNITRGLLGNATCISVCYSMVRGGSSVSIII